MRIETDERGGAVEKYCWERKRREREENREQGVVGGERPRGKGTQY